MCRSGEITVPSQAAFNSAKHVQVGPPSTISEGDKVTGTLVQLPWEKVAKNKGAKVGLLQRSDHLDPVAAMNFHLRVNAGTASDSLFSYQSRDGTRRHLTKNAFIKRVNAALEKAGRPSILGHSFGIGGATQHLLNGLPEQTVKLAGRWKSDSFLTYWRNIERLMLFASAASAGRASVAPPQVSALGSRGPGRGR